MHIICSAACEASGGCLTFYGLWLATFMSSGSIPVHFHKSSLHNCTLKNSQGFWEALTLTYGQRGLTDQPRDEHRWICGQDVGTRVSNHLAWFFLFETPMSSINSLPTHCREHCYQHNEAGLGRCWQRSCFTGFHLFQFQFVSLWNSCSVMWE